MIKKIILMSGLTFSAMGVNAQTTLFQENFEEMTITSFLNDRGTDSHLPVGVAPCGDAANGDASSFNSTTVDFKPMQNQGSYMGVRDSCGGWGNTATVSTAELDFSSATDSIIFSCKYFAHNGTSGFLNGGEIQIHISAPDAAYMILQNLYTTYGKWDSTSFKVPMYKATSETTIKIHMNGASAVDDIKVIGYTNVSNAVKEIDTITTTVYPNPATNDIYVKGYDNSANVALTIYSVLGELVYADHSHELSSSVNIEMLEAGMYVLSTNQNGNTSQIRFVKN